MNSANAATNWSNTTFTGTVTYTADNWGLNDNFTDAVFVDTVMNLGGESVVGDGIYATGNQPLVNATMTGANFTGATFNWNPYTSGGNTRFNIFRDTAGAGVGNAGMSLVDTVWNINIAGTALANVNEVFFDGAGSISAATKADALDLSGAALNFTGTTSLSVTAGVAIMANLSESEVGFGNGAKYDAAFTNNNFLAFGYVDAAALDAALQTSGWQAIPEPSSYALLAGLLGMSYVMVRRRK